MYHLPKAVYLLHKEKEGQAKRWLEQKICQSALGAPTPAVRWECIQFWCELYFPQENPFLPVGIVPGTASVSMSSESFLWGSMCIQHKRSLKMAYQNDGKEVRGI